MCQVKVRSKVKGTGFRINLRTTDCQWKRVQHLLKFSKYLQVKIKLKPQNITMFKVYMYIMLHLFMFSG